MPLVLRGGARLRSVVNTFIGLQERMSHTMTIPSWDVTADSEPDSKHAVTVQNDAWSASTMKWMQVQGRVEGWEGQLGKWCENDTHATRRAAQVDMWRIANRKKSTTVQRDRLGSCAWHYAKDNVKWGPGPQLWVGFSR